jgi:hypothetical protein
MRNEVRVSVGGQTYTLPVDDQSTMTNEAARVWLDQQFVEMDCEPLRASGKLLLADKVLVVARDAGAQRFADSAWAHAFAAAASAALGKPSLRVDADAMSVTY